MNLLATNRNLLATNEYCLAANVNQLATNKYCLVANKNLLAANVNLLAANKYRLAANMNLLATNKYYLAANVNRLERNRMVRLGGGIGYVGRLVGNCAIFFFLGVFWLPLRKVVYRIAHFISLA